MKLNPYIYTLLVILLSVVFLPVLLSFGIRYIPHEKQPGLSGDWKVFGDETVTQTFVSQKNNLTGFGLSLKNPGLRNANQVILELYDDENKLVRNTAVSGLIIPDGAFIKFIFGPISDSKDKEYKFVLSAPNADEDNSFGVFKTMENKTWMLSAMDRNGAVEGNVAFESLHRPASRIGLIKNIYGEWMRRLWADKLFFGLYFLMVGGLVITLVVNKSGR